MELIMAVISIMIQAPSLQPQKTQEGFMISRFLS